MWHQRAPMGHSRWAAARAPRQRDRDRLSATATGPIVGLLVPTAIVAPIATAITPLLAGAAIASDVVGAATVAALVVVLALLLAWASTAVPLLADQRLDGAALRREKSCLRLRRLRRRDGRSLSLYTYT